MAGGKEEVYQNAFDKKYGSLGYDVSNRWVTDALKFWEVGKSKADKNDSPSRWSKEFINWYGEYAPSISQTQSLYDLYGDVNIHGSERDAIMKNYEQVQEAMESSRQLPNNVKDYEKQNWLYKDLYQGIMGKDGNTGSFQKFLNDVDQKMTTTPGGTSPEIVDGIRIDRGNAFGNNLRAKSSALGQIAEADQTMNTILRQLELKRSENSLSMSEMSNSADLMNRKKSANLKAMNSQYELSDMNQNTNDELWGNIIGAGLSAGAKTWSILARNKMRKSRSSDDYNYDDPDISPFEDYPTYA